MGTGKDHVLTWELRVKILRDCAAALKYLHHHISGCIVHRDIKVIFNFVLFFKNLVLILLNYYLTVLILMIL